MAIPDWAVKFREKGTQITEIGGRYYLYRVKSKWDPEKHRARKITEEYLGRITPEGVKKQSSEGQVSVVEFGATDLIMRRCRYIIDALKIYDHWESILVMAIFRLLHASPLKRIDFYYQTSYMSEILEARTSPGFLSSLLRTIGLGRENTMIFLRHFVVEDDIAVIDLTTVFSMSGGIVSSVPGYDHGGEHLPGVRFTLLFGLKHMKPMYYRFVPGSIRDVSTIRITMRESGIRKALLIGDKGFYSESNVSDLEKSHINYILPLKRNSDLIDYGPSTGDRSGFSGYFMFDNRPVWYHSSRKGRRVVLFLDESLRLEEERDMLLRDNGKEEFHEKQFILGTMAVITDLDRSEKEIYGLLKQRSNVEQAFDTFKNVLEADRTYMRDDYALEGWFLVNFVSLLIYYEIYNLLREHDLLSKYSPMDVLVHMSRIQKLKMHNKWVTSEIPKKTRIIKEKLEQHIT